MIDFAPSFPFTQAEWSEVADVALLVVNSTLTDDHVLRASHLLDLLDVLANLQTRYGDHPVLLETQADLTENEGERIALYRQAAALAQTHGLPTLSIRLSLASVLLQFNQSDEATAALAACERELPTAEKTDQASWAELVAKARNA